MPNHTSIEYAKFVITKLLCLGEIASVSELLKFGKPETDGDRKRLDKAVMQAIWDIRNASVDSNLGKLLNRDYEYLHKTKTYLDSRKHPPFDFDGLVWNTKVRGQSEGCSSPVIGMFYSNAFDHAITYHITRGWGLSEEFVHRTTGNGWSYNNGRKGTDPSIWLSSIEALSSKVLTDNPVISAKDIPEDVVATWGQDESIASRTGDRIRLRAIGLLDQAMAAEGK